MTSVRASVAAAAVVLALAPCALAQTADDIVEKHLAALGGRAALSKLTSQLASGTIGISIQGANLPGTIEIAKKRPNKSRALLKLDLSSVGATEVIVDQRCDGKSAFESNSMQGDREITGSQLQNMLNESFPSQLLDYKEAGAKVELQGKDTIGGRPVLALLYTPKAGPAAKLFFDAETLLISRSVTTHDVPSTGGMVEEIIDVGDYRTVDGVKTAFSVTITGAGQTITVTLAKAEYNVAIDESVFSRPAAK